MGALITIITAGILLTITTASILSINPATLSQENDGEPYPTDNAVPSQENDGEPYPTDNAVPSQENDAVPSSGNIATINVGVYSDAACNQELTSMDWGDIFPGESVNKIIYVKNTGNTQIKLNMTATNWNPSTANESMTLTWNKEKTTLNADEIKEARLTLFVSQDICDIEKFSVDIVFTGTVHENP